jgi:hypothetical protein
MVYRLPNINGKTDSEKVEQIKDFLFQLVRQLNMEQENKSTENVGGKS